MVFKVGQKVRLIDEDGEGEIIRLMGDVAIVLMEHGFEETISTELLVPAFQISINDQSIVKKVSTEKKKTSKPSKAKDKSKLEVDLHAGLLIGNTAGLSNHEIVLLQLAEAKNAIDKARMQKINKVILIHGKGSGKLRSEIHKMLSHLDNLEYYDAEYRLYSHGATEIRLF